MLWYKKVMQNQLFKLLTFTAIFIYVAICLHLGFYFDLQTVATYLLASIACPILAYHSLVFIKKAVFNYAQVLNSLSRQVTLQRVDPLLN